MTDDNSRAVAQLIKIWPKVYPDAHTELDFRNHCSCWWQPSLCAITDKRVNMVTLAVRKYRTAMDYADAPRADVETDQVHGLLS